MLTVLFWNIIIKSWWLHEFKRTVPVENNFFIIRFSAIMQRITIVQNKIIRIICSCLFFCPANIYRPSLGKVRLGRPNPNQSQLINFYLRIKKIPSYSELYELQCIAGRCSIFIFFNYLKKWIIKPENRFNYIYNNY